MYDHLNAAMQSAEWQLLGLVSFENVLATWTVMKGQGTACTLLELHNTFGPLGHAPNCGRLDAVTMLHTIITGDAMLTNSNSIATVIWKQKCFTTPYCMYIQSLLPLLNSLHPFYLCPWAPTITSTDSGYAIQTHPPAGQTHWVSPGPKRCSPHPAACSAHWPTSPTIWLPTSATASQATSCWDAV